MKWEDLSINDFFKNLNTNFNDLSDEEAQKRILNYVYKELIEKQWLHIL